MFPSSVVFWRINSFSIWSKLKENLLSPSFVLNSPTDLWFKWHLYLEKNENSQSYGIYLKRSSKDAAVVSVGVSLHFEFAVFIQDESTHHTKVIDFTFEKDNCYGFRFLFRLEHIEKKLNKLIADRLKDEDYINIRCKIWFNDTATIPGMSVTRLTSYIPAIEESVFDWNIDNALNSKDSNVKVFSLKPLLGNSLVVTLSHITHEKDKVIRVVISGVAKTEFSWVCCLTFAKTKTLCLLESGTIQKEDLPFQRVSSPIRSTQDNVNEHFYGTSLILNCKFSIMQKNMQYSTSNIILTSPNALYDSRTRSRKDNTFFSLPDEMREIIWDDNLSDFTIQVESTSIPVHSAPLIARSSVFRELLESKKEEKVLTIEDLDVGTVQNMLIYIYSDNFGTINMDQAMKLYSAADTYKLYGLMYDLMDFIELNLSIHNVFDVLLVAEKHMDYQKNLMNAVIQYLVTYEKEVAISEEFKSFSDKNPSLAAQTWVNVMNYKYNGIKVEPRMYDDR